MTTMSLAFNGIQLNPVSHNNQIWLTSSELASALGYAQDNAVTKIYDRNKDEFNDAMTTILPDTQIGSLGESSGLQRLTRIFSLRGCHLIAMFARTKVAKLFRQWVLDILDKEVGEPKPYGLKEKPTAKTPERINRQQLNQIEEIVHKIITCCHQHRVASHWMYKWIRETYGLQNGVQELPAVHFEQVYGHLHVMYEKGQRYLKMRVAADDLFCREILGKGQLQFEITEQMLLPS